MPAEFIETDLNVVDDTDTGVANTGERGPVIPAGEGDFVDLDHALEEAEGSGSLSRPDFVVDVGERNNGDFDDTDTNVWPAHDVVGDGLVFPDIHLADNGSVHFGEDFSAPTAESGGSGIRSGLAEAARRKIEYFKQNPTLGDEVLAAVVSAAQKVSKAISGF